MPEGRITIRPIFAPGCAFEARVVYCTAAKKQGKKGKNGTEGLHRPDQRAQNQGLRGLRPGGRGGLPHLQPGHHPAAEVLHGHPAFGAPVHHAHVHRRPGVGRHQRPHHGPHRGHGEARPLRPLPPLAPVRRGAPGPLGGAHVPEMAGHGRGGPCGGHRNLCHLHLHPLRHGLHGAAYPLRVVGLRGHHRRRGTEQALRLPVHRRGSRLHPRAAHRQLRLFEAPGRQRPGGDR